MSKIERSVRLNLINKFSLKLVKRERDHIRDFRHPMVRTAQYF